MAFGRKIVRDCDEKLLKELAKEDSTTSKEIQMAIIDASNLLAFTIRRAREYLHP